jgi:hypothetical protein
MGKHDGIKSGWEDQDQKETRLTRDIIILHDGTGIDEFEGIRGKVSVL